MLILGYVIWVPQCHWLIREESDDWGLLRELYWTIWFACYAIRLSGETTWLHNYTARLRKNFILFRRIKNWENNGETTEENRLRCIIKNLVKSAKDSQLFHRGPLKTNEKIFRSRQKIFWNSKFVVTKPKKLKHTVKYKVQIRQKERRWMGKVFFGKSISYIGCKWIEGEKWDAQNCLQTCRLGNF